ncbi:MAG: isoprenyl transferase [Rhodobacteraceae bacterium]|nr:isoprenyl transferase [Paracoccaceae bacterium]
MASLNQAVRREAASCTATAEQPRAPRHVALIMDGNGRWAHARGLRRLEGHSRGVDTVREILRASPELGVEYLTLYAFSTENWRRPKNEVDGLMNLFRYYIRREADQLDKDGVQVRFIGDSSRLAPDLQCEMAALVERTRENRRLVVAIAINYGGRAEIVDAARRLAEQAARGEIEAGEIDEAALTGALSAPDIPDPDLVIRTSGEQRLSNFLLWQSAYSELMFVPEPWPDFTADAFRRAIARFAGRDRRYGAVAG